MAEMPVIRVPPEWKDNLLLLRDRVPVEQGSEAIAALAALAATETGQSALAQLGPLAKALQQNPQRTLKGLTAATEEGGQAQSVTTTQQCPENKLGESHRRLQGIIPSSVIGGVARIVELSMVDPSAARDILGAALKRLERIG
jgi:hypothetical protein